MCGTTTQANQRPASAEVWDLEMVALGEGAGRGQGWGRGRRGGEGRREGGREGAGGRFLSKPL